MKTYKELIVWQKAHSLTLNVYKSTARFPREELFSLTKQIRRCSSSVGANIAEGVGRRSNGDFDRFLQIASGSLFELDYHLLLARDLHYLPEQEHRQLELGIIEVRKMLSALMLKVKRDRASA